MFYKNIKNSAKQLLNKYESENPATYAAAQQICSGIVGLLVGIVVGLIYQQLKMKLAKTLQQPSLAWWVIIRLHHNQLWHQHSHRNNPALSKKRPVVATGLFCELN